MQERDIFIEVLQRETPAARAAYLLDACAADTDLRQRVERLLVEHESQQSFILDAPAVAAAGAAADASAGDATVDDRLVALDPQTCVMRPGTMIGRYKLLEPIGEGGYGTVFMAEQTTPVQRRVALKIIKAGMDTRQVIARFEAERQALALMDHPNIAKVFDAGVTDAGRPYFVMELVKGVPITRYCDGHCLAPRQRLELFVQVCQAVQHAHQKGIIHRDLKPTNVLVAQYDGKPVPKVIDFGVAKATGQRLTDATMFTGFGDVIGTLEYMSPEQAEVNQLDVDTRSDIYSLGVLLYELLTGSTPLENKRVRQAGMLEMLRVVREEEPPMPSTRITTSAELSSIAACRGLEPKKLSGLVRGELDWIVMRALEKDRKRRYETANGLASDVRRYLDDEAVQACPPSAGYRFRKFARRNRATLATAALLALVLVFASVISTWQALRARRAEGLAQARFEAEKEARARAVTEAAKATAVSEFLQEMLYSANPDRAKGLDYTVRKLLDDVSVGTMNQLEGQPQVEAEVQATIGRAYYRLGLSDNAQPHLERAVALRRSAGLEHEKVAESLIDLAMNQEEQGRHAEAEAGVRQALEIYRAAGVAGRPLVGGLWALQRCLHAQSRVPELEAVTEQALSLERKSPGVEIPEISGMLHVLARVKNEQHKYPEAETLARQAIERRRRQPQPREVDIAWALLNLDTALRAQKKFAQAEPVLREALDIFRRCFGESHHSVEATLRSLQEVFTATGDEAALARLRADWATHLVEAHERDVDDMKVRIQLAKMLADAGAWETAMSQYASVITRKPELAEGWGGRAQCYQAKRQFDQAISDYTEAIRLQPQNMWWWHERGYCNQELGKHEAVIRDYSHAIPLDTNHGAGPYFRRGQAYKALGKLKEAEQDFSRAVELNPTAPMNWSARGALYGQMAEWKKASDDLVHAAKLSNPADPPHLLSDHALVQLAMHDVPKYRQTCAKLVQQTVPKMPDGDAACHTAWACVLLPDSGADAAQVVRVAEQAVTHNARDPDYLIAYGAALYRAGRFAEAAKTLADAEAAYRHEQATPTPGIYVNTTVIYCQLFLAMTQQRLAHHEEAAQWLSKAVEEIDRTPPATRPDNDPLWRRRLIMQLLRREAGELIGVKAKN